MAPWLWVALLLVSGGYFLYRVNVVRPQVLSILFVLWSIHFILNRRRIALAVLCVIYTFSYTAFHLPFIFASLVYGFHLLFENENDWKTPLTALLAMGAGMLASPYFPDNFLMFYVQNFFIPWMSVGGGIDLHMGGEFSPMHTRAAITAHAAVVLPLVIGFVLAIRLPEKHERKTLSLLPIVLFLIFITCFSKRFTEYSVPVTLLFCGFFFTPYIKKYLECREPKEIVILLSAAGIMLAGLAMNSHASTVQVFRGIGPPVLEEAAKYLLKHTEEDEVVFTADWDDAPELFYFNHKNRYLVFLDPCFMYYWNPEVWRRWDAVSNGRMGSQTYTVLKDEFRVRYGVATSNFQQLRNIIERDPRMRIVHQTSGAFVFKLDIAQDTAPAPDAAGSN
ncbi:MAG: hypothetical protein KatS3mg031_0267 [Chitinophagales bacterium]|nr:MAG: hypothetical protein KatS3mg031_0267 [Chitinophagales bacterium]